MGVSDLDLEHFKKAFTPLPVAMLWAWRGHKSVWGVLGRQGVGGKMILTCVIHAAGKPLGPCLPFDAFDPYQLCTLSLMRRLHWALGPSEKNIRTKKSQKSFHKINLVLRGLMLGWEDQCVLRTWVQPSGKQPLVCGEEH